MVLSASFSFHWIVQRGWIRGNHCITQCTIDLSELTAIEWDEGHWQKWLATGWQFHGGNWLDGTSAARACTSLKTRPVCCIHVLLVCIWEHLVGSYASRVAGLILYPHEKIGFSNPQSAF